MNVLALAIIALLVILIVVLICRDVAAAERTGRDPLWLRMTRLGADREMYRATELYPWRTWRTRQEADFDEWEQELDR